MKFLDAPDTKIAFVAAGSKHTVCIDLDGQLWYFGNKLSVGIREPKRKLQFEPVRLSPLNRSELQRVDQGFVFLDANAESNIVISANDMAPYQFGLANANRTEHEIIEDEY